MLECVAMLAALVQYSCRFSCKIENRQVLLAALGISNSVELQNNLGLLVFTDDDHDAIAE